ncbi:hypothetical protein ACTMTI_18165 [Nonomuraea sp. H19]|uniref:hypothetical protein n=1 Tax=Nonomuraea sp. H19 TaxID=3452206 RepID=UPI003F8C6615
MPQKEHLEAIELLGTEVAPVDVLDPLDNHRYAGVRPIGAEEYFRQAMRRRTYEPAAMTGAGDQKRPSAAHRVFFGQELDSEWPGNWSGEESTLGRRVLRRRAPYR